MLSGLDLLLFASWLHTDGTSLGTGKPAAIDAVLLLSHPLAYRCHGLGRTRGGEGAGLVGPWSGLPRASFLSDSQFIQVLYRVLGRSFLSLHIND